MRGYLVFFSFICCALFSHDDYTGEFKDKGYLWVRGFYSPKQVRFLRDTVEKAQLDAENCLVIAKEKGLSLQELVKQFPELPIVVPERGDSSQVCRVEDSLSCYPELELFVQDTLTSYLGDLLGEPYVPFKDKINFKWPGGGAFPYHQDYPAFAIVSPGEYVTAMVCIDKATFENGCLQIAKDWKEDFRGDPRVEQELLEDGKVVLKYIEGGKMHGTIVPELVENIEWMPINAEPGDVIFFSSYVPHFSEVNESDMPRRAMFFTFNRLVDGENKDLYYREKRNDLDNPMFHFGTPTNARTKDD